MSILDRIKLAAGNIRNCFLELTSRLFYIFWRKRDFLRGVLTQKIKYRVFGTAVCNALYHHSIQLHLKFLSFIIWYLAVGLKIDEHCGNNRAFGDDFEGKFLLQPG